jgi:hypothetical protein
MKNRKLLLLGLILLSAALLLWVRLGSRQQATPAQQAATPAPQEKPSPPEPANALTPDDLAKTPWPGTDEQKRSRIAEVREVMNQANQPVSFWGMVVDQNNEPLPGVRVKLSLKHTREVLPGGTQDVFDYFDTVTDAGGLFSLTGKKGALLSVEKMEKEGYEAGNVSGRPFWYAPALENMRYLPDAQKPEVFRMWKLAGAETLLSKNIGTRIPYDGTPVYFDLLKAQETARGGDIKVTLSRTPLNIKRGREKYDWTATIEAVEGGVIASTDEFMYLAPEAGYETKLVVSMSADDPAWSPQKSVSFYLKTKGKYARVRAEFATDSEKPKTGFMLGAYINPSGSRNLEYSPAQNLPDFAPPQAGPAQAPK